MKRILIISSFIAYQFFMPFVLVNCGQDIPYDRSQVEEDAEASENADCDIDICKTQEFLTADCVACVNQEEPADNTGTLTDDEGTGEETDEATNDTENEEEGSDDE